LIELVSLQSTASSIPPSTMSTSDAGFKAAVEEAEAAYNEGGVPIGACLVSSDGTILGRGHNMRVQKESKERGEVVSRLNI